MELFRGMDSVMVGGGTFISMVVCVMMIWVGMMVVGLTFYSLLFVLFNFSRGN